MRTLIVEDEAKADLKEAHDWYEKRERGLGARFESHLQDASSWIDENVGLCLEFLPGVRRHHMKVFPYSVFFTVTDTELRVVAVLHAARHPRIVRKRKDQ